MWPGLNEQNRRSDSGKGSQTAISQTSRVGSGCLRDSAVSPDRTLERYRSGEEDMGGEATFTRCAEGVEGGLSMEASNKRYRRFRQKV